MDLKGKVAIVTGGGTGMGKEITKLLAAAGAHVVVNYSRSEAEAIATAQELETYHVQALPIKADVSSAAAVAALVVTRWWAHASAEQLNQMRASFPLQRSIAPEEVATAALELIRNDAMTGQTLAQDAGLLLL